VLENVGSFSVGRQIQPGNIPRGNILFQELVEAVFELEALIIRDVLSNNSAINETSSSSSSSSGSSNGISSINIAPRNISRMAAINRRAQFLPHKDSGKFTVSVIRYYYHYHHHHHHHHHLITS